MSRRSRHLVYLERSFLLLVLATVLTIFLLETVHNGRVFQRPVYGLQRTYVAGECSDKRLGNAMFIYAAVVGLARRFNGTKMMERRCRLTGVFNLSAVLVTDLSRSLPMYARFEEFGRMASAYDVRIRKLPSRNTLLSGYFQSWRYFEDARAEVRREYAFPESTKRVASDFLSLLLPSDWTGRRYVRVGVHVRRGDLLKDYYRNYGYTTPDGSYYQRAMNYFRSRYSLIQFVVCSDDIGWTKENISGQDVVYSEGRRDDQDMAILSLCNHTIMSVGSFGWWAAWLANGTTIYYDGWPKEYSMLEYHVNKKTYFPPHWIPMR